MCKGARVPKRSLSFPEKCHSHTLIYLITNHKYYSTLLDINQDYIVKLDISQIQHYLVTLDNLALTRNDFY